MRLEATPPATASIGDREIGNTPAEIELPEDGSSVDVLVRREGYRAQTIALNRDSDPVVSVALERMSTRKPRPSHRPAQAKPPAGPRARVSGGSFVMEVQIGHPLSQRPSAGGGKTIEAASAIKR